MNKYRDIFLSHSSQDKKYTGLLQERLEKIKYKVWYDNTDIRFGDNLQEKIEEGLSNSFYGIIMISRHYLQLGSWINFEFKHILNSGKIFLITHNITLDEIRTEYPRVYENIKGIRIISSEPGLDYVLDQVNKVVRDSIINQRQEFARLRDFLVAEEWKEADIETYNLVNTKHALLSLPREDFNMLNRLWLMYSGEHYGFSTQKEIYKQACRQSGNYLQRYYKFCKSVGWEDKGSLIEILNYSPHANTLKGYFPTLVYLKNELPVPLTSNYLEYFKASFGKRMELLAWYYFFLLVAGVLLFLFTGIFIASFIETFSIMHFFHSVLCIFFLGVVFWLFRRGTGAKRRRARNLYKLFISKTFNL